MEIRKFASSRATSMSATDLSDPASDLQCEDCASLTPTLFQIHTEIQIAQGGLDMHLGLYLCL